MSDYPPRVLPPIWLDVESDPPPDGERVEVFAPGWSSVAHGVQVAGKWTVWFGGPNLDHMVPSVWRITPRVK